MYAYILYMYHTYISNNTITLIGQAETDRQLITNVDTRRPETKLVVYLLQRICGIRYSRNP